MSDCLSEDKSKATMSNYLNLPEELFVEILVRVPIEDLESVAEHYSLRVDNKDVEEYKQLHFPSHIGTSLRACFDVGGSINGKHVRIPQPCVTFSSHGPDRTFTGFGREPVEVEVEIYSLNANCWRSITHIAPKYAVSPKPFGSYGNSFVNGAIHMLARDKDRNLILAFDVSEEVFREIPLPECVSNGKPMWLTRLLKYGQSIAAITVDCRGETMTVDCGGEVKKALWVMKEYGVAMSWTNVFMEVAESVPRVLFLRQNEEQMFVVLKDGWIASADIKKKHFEIFGVRSDDEYAGYPAIDGFVESLVLLDNGNACCDGDPQEDARSVDGDSIIQMKKLPMKMIWMIQMKI
ncbi:hypothetical protein COLO4_13285 [Corchorus olitorius]|uniref:F-box associated beta-propeller type 1 domain-containing protein n=1 Tax=Corchorus olitorius TaxID=93759 RepID=A0A1R3JX63_9ROSI|nr:hypothetical protein COLO4_13285 [Corchorus olitorius]